LFLTFFLLRAPAWLGNFQNFVSNFLSSHWLAPSVARPAKFPHSRGQTPHARAQPTAPSPPGAGRAGHLTTPIPPATTRPATPSGVHAGPWKAFFPLALTVSLQNRSLASQPKF
jgi:hypothetical protein